LEDLKITTPHGAPFVPHNTWYARFLLVDTKQIAERTSPKDRLSVSGYAQLARRSWLDPDKIRGVLRIGEFRARVVLTTPALYADEPTFEDALWFACRELNPMLETFTTLFGIKNDIDIVVEHGLRPTPQLLHHIVQPFRQTTPKGRFTL
jgi:hypothetical protein